MREATGRGGQAALELRTPHGCATVYLQGAHVTSWVPAGGDEVLFVSDAARFAPGAAIRGGVPVAFPQFAELGPLPMHGFAQTSPWQVVGRSDTGVRLALRATEATLVLWPHRFVAELEVDLAPSRLAVAFTVRNADHAPLQWSGTLHTYVALAARTARLRGLGPGRYIDRGHGSVWCVDPARLLRIRGHTDRAYLDAGPEVAVDDGRRALLIDKAGFRDTVVWNPGPETSPRFPDLRPGDHAAFLCIEAAEVRPVTLAPAACWQGRQVLQTAPVRGSQPH